MNLNIFLMTGHGFYVWSSFLLTTLACLFLFLKTRKSLKKLEKEFIKEAKTLTNKEFEDIKKQKVVKAILLSYSKN